MTPSGALATLGHIRADIWHDARSGFSRAIRGDSSLHTPKSGTQLANHYLRRRLPTYSRCTNACTTKRTHPHAYNRCWLTKPFLYGPLWRIRNMPSSRTSIGFSSLAIFRSPRRCLLYPFIFREYVLWPMGLGRQLRRTMTIGDKPGFTPLAKILWACRPRISLITPNPG